MEKLTTVLLVVLLAVIGTCSELKKDGKGEKHVNAVEGRPLPGDHAPHKEPSQKPKFLPIRVEKESGSKKKSTDDILRHIGMSKVRSPANNHRKRLASQSRKSHNEKHAADSHVYVINLPSNRYYYEDDAPKTQAEDNKINFIPLDFKSNGKPRNVYHWNLPTVKKMMARKTGNAKLAKEHYTNQVLKPGPVWPKEEQPLHYRRVSYYKPKKPSKQAFHKFFPGNGKPFSIHVIEGNRRPPAQKRRIH